MNPNRLLAPFIWCSPKVAISLSNGELPLISLDDDCCLCSSSGSIDDMTIAPELYGIPAEVLSQMNESSYALALYDDDNIALVCSAIETAYSWLGFKDTAMRSCWLAVDFSQGLVLQLNGQAICVNLSDNSLGSGLIYLDDADDPNGDLEEIFFELLLGLEGQDDINEFYESMLESANGAMGTNYQLVEGTSRIAIKCAKRLCFENILYESNESYSTLSQRLAKATLLHLHAELDCEIYISSDPEDHS